MSRPHRHSAHSRADGVSSKPAVTIHCTIGCLGGSASSAVATPARAPQGLIPESELLPIPWERRELDEPQEPGRAGSLPTEPPRAGSRWVR